MTFFQLRASTRILAAAAVAVWLLVQGSAGLAEDRLVDQDPYDLIELKNGTVLRANVVNLKPRVVPEKPVPSSELQLRLSGEAELQAVKWASIKQLRLFEHLLLEEADRFIKEQRFDDAFDTFQFLASNNPNFPGLKEANDRFLFENADHLVQKKNDELAVALLSDLKKRNDSYPGAKELLSKAAARLFENHWKGENYSSLRRLMKALEITFPGNPVFDDYRSRLIAASDEMTAKGKAAADNNDLRQAHDALRAALGIWPENQATIELMIKVNTLYPRVVVGVTGLSQKGGSHSIYDASQRRVNRLLNRTLFEFRGFGTEGGKYVSPFAEVEKADLGKRLAIHIHPNIYYSQGDVQVTGYDVSQKLLAMCRPDDADYNSLWSLLMQGVTVRDVFDVDVRLKQVHVSPEALLQINIAPLHKGDASAAEPNSNFSMGPYFIAEHKEKEIVFLSHPRYFLKTAGPKEIVEKEYRDPREGLSALRRGNISVLDKINPWDIALAKDEPNLVVEPYGAPSIHCLIPNVKNPLLAMRTFRRALEYGINRESILKAQLLRGGESPRTRVISGPFLQGDSIADTVGYAYNEQIKPRPFDPLMAITLTQAALRQLSEERKKKGEAEIKEVPEMTLAYPPDETALVACRAIQRQLKPLGIKIQLKEVPQDQFLKARDEYDLLYAVLSVWEPIVDADRLLGPNGLVKRTSPYVDRTLQELEDIENWSKGARDVLQTVHQLTHEDVSLIPLWQLTDHFAFHDSIQGIGKRPVLLYQDVEKWKTNPTATKAP